MTIPAHNLFDYPGLDAPGGGDGWRFRAIDQANVFHPMLPIEAIGQTATPLAFLGCADPHCIIGRDFLHPGYECRPCLQWTAPMAGRFRLQAAFAVVRQSAPDQLAISVYFDDARLMTAHIRYPEIACIDLPFIAKAGSILRVIVHAVGRIDNLLAYYAASVEEGPANANYFESPLTTPRAETDFYSVERDQAWSVFDAEMTQGAGEGDVRIAEAFVPGPVEQPKPSDAVVAAINAVYEPLLRHQREAFRKPRFFAARE